VNKKLILITGATGLIGSALTKKLTEKGYTPVILSNTISNHEKNIFKWHPRLKISELIPSGNYYGVINLAGANIAELKWNEKGRNQIFKSRVNSTLYLKSIIDTLPSVPEHIISASAIGYYGTNDEEVKTETSEQGGDFPARVCVAWENAAWNLETKNSHLSILRIGIVLAKEGGFYKKISQLANWKIASSLGTGKQPVCWIHIDDLVNIMLDILENRIKPGVYNAVAKCDSNKDITKMIASKNGQPFLWPPVPGLLIKMIFRNKAEIFTKGSRVSSNKIKSQGYEFKYLELEKAISALSK